jgi:probable rRNA maturation factor
MKIQVHSRTRSVLTNKTVGLIARAVLRGEKAKPAGELSVVLVNDAVIRGINARFLKRNRPTDVIAFELGGRVATSFALLSGTDPNSRTFGGDMWGEVYVSTERTSEQAVDYGVPPKEELARCVIHGVLHLLGYDDGTAFGRREMKAKEEEYLGKAGKLLR